MKITKQKTIGIVDYGIGNHNSVLRSIRRLGFRARVSNNINQLDESDILLLPGVGAFPVAMEKLHSLKLVDYLKASVQQNKPLIGICLGMQLLAESSTEYKFTKGLGLIPGTVEAIGEPRWHIGWNSLEAKENYPLLKASDGEVMYFNHSFTYRGPEEFVASSSRIKSNSSTIVSAIQRDTVIGLQFHPEKSQTAGLQLLKRIIQEGHK